MATRPKPALTTADSPGLPRNDALRLWSVRLLPFALTLAFYGISLTFPLYWDDVPNFFVYNGRSFGRLWTDATGFPYYRPAAMSVWKLIVVALGRGPSVAMHALNLACHALNGLLVGLLAQEFHPTRKAWTVALWASAASVLFPFAPVAVNLVASLFHIALLTVSLAATAALVRFYRTRQARWAIVALGACALAPYVHESGVATGAIAAASMLVLAYPSIRRHEAAVGAMATLVSVAFLPVWLAVPKDRPPGLGLGGLSTISESLRFFLEAFSFPIQPLAVPLMQFTGWQQLTVVLVLGLPAVVAGAILVWRAGLARPAAIGAAWYWLAALPSVLALPYSYMVTSTRLMVFPSAGAVLFWTFVILSVGRLLRRPLAQTAASWAALIAMLAVPAFHVIREGRLHATALAPIWDLAEIANTYPGSRQLVVNPIDWLAYQRSIYAVGHEGAEVKAAYVSLNDLAAINGADSPDLHGLQFDALRPNLEDHYHAVGAGPADPAAIAALLPTFDHIWSVDYSDEAIATRHIGWVKHAAATAPQRYLAHFEPGTFLVDAELSPGNGGMTLALTWIFLGPSHQGIIFAHLFDCEGNVLSLVDSPPLSGLYPWALAQPGDRIHEVRHFLAAEPPADGCVYAEVGVFDPADGLRFPVVASDGGRFANDMLVVQ